MEKEFRNSLAESSGQLLGGCNQGIGWAAFSTRGSTGEELATKLIQVLAEFISLWLYH